MRHEVVHQGDKLILHMDGGRINLRLVRVRGRTVTLLIDSENGPVECEVIADRANRPRPKNGRIRRRKFGEINDR